MLIYRLLPIVAMLLYTFFSQAQEKASFTKGEVKEDLQILWTALKEMHPALDRYTSINQLKAKLDLLSEQQ